MIEHSPNILAREEKNTTTKSFDKFTIKKKSFYRRDTLVNALST